MKQVITVDGTDIPVTVTGEGDPLVLVHGTAFGGEETWGGLREVFESRHTVIVPELSGSNAVEDEGPLSLDRLITQVKRVVDECASGSAHVVGFSLGAVVAASFAAAHPESVRRLVLSSGWMRADVYLSHFLDTWLALVNADDDGFGRFAAIHAFSRSYLNAVGDSAVHFMAMGCQPTAQSLRQIELDRHVDIRADVARIEAPTLVTGNVHDTTVPVELSRALHASIPGSEYEEYETGHVVLFEKPTEYAERVLTFLAAT